MIPRAAELAAIVLAAGASRRLPGQIKLLRSLKARPMIAHVLDRVTQLGLGQVIVVTGHHALSIERVVRHWPVEIVRNPEPELGMGRSIAAGASALRADIKGAFVCLGDMPLVPEAIYRQLAERFVGAPAHAVIAPAHGKDLGHPKLFGAAHFPALSALNDDEGARSVVKTAGRSLIRVSVACDGILRDFDTARDFEACEFARPLPAMPPSALPLRPA